MQLHTHDIHIWSADLSLDENELKAKEAFLSPDELLRARQFHFPIHQKRFIAARGFLRELLSLYLHQSPADIRFTYSSHQKPQLATPADSELTFNLAHSEDQALFAFSLQHAVGVDLEKIEARKYNLALAKRYFSEQENEALMALPEAARVTAFFHLWSRKEAIIKAIGKGLSLPLASFSVSIQAECEQIYLENTHWTLVQLAAPSGFAAALASNQPINTLSYWQFVNHKPQKRLTWTLT